MEFEEKVIEENNKYSFFVRFFTNYGFYEKKDDTNNYGIWSSFSLLVCFVIHIFVMNCSFAVYYNDRIYHDIMTGTSTIVLILTCFLQICIFVASYKRYDEMNCSTKNIGWIWITVIGLWITFTFGIAHFFIPYNGWPIDEKFKETSMIRNIFFIVQGSILCVLLVALLCIGIYYLQFLPSCCKFCCEPLRNEIVEAKNKVQEYENYQQGYNNIYENKEITVDVNSDISMTE